MTRKEEIEKLQCKLQVFTPIGATLIVSVWGSDAYSHYFTDENGRAKVSNDWKEREHSEDIVDIWEHR